MISVVNKEFFSMHRYIVSEKTTTGTKKYTTLVNLHTDPKNAELRRYVKKAFLSFVFTTDYNPKDLSDDEIYEIMQKSEINQYSMYTDVTNDNSYEKITSMFLDNGHFSDIKFPTMIFEATNKFTAKNLCVIGMPIKGIISTIYRSQTHKQYNGSLVVCKVFKYRENENSEYEFYNKIFYIVADVITEFSFTEFIKTNDPVYGISNTYLYSLSMDKSSKNMNIQMIERRASALVPYVGREEFFEPQDPNIFRLSDVPKDLLIKNSTISKGIETENLEERKT